MTDMKKGTRHDILGDHVETDKHVLDRARSAPSFRGNVVFGKHDAKPLDPELCQMAEVVCAPKAIASKEVDGSLWLTLDRGKCITCGLCAEVAPAMFEVQSRYAQPVRSRPDLVVTWKPDGAPGGPDHTDEIGRRLAEKITKVLGLVPNGQAVLAVHHMPHKQQGKAHSHSGAGWTPGARPPTQSPHAERN